MKHFVAVSLVFLVGLAVFQACIHANDVPQVAATANSLRVASLSIFPVKWDKAGNADKIEKIIRDAVAAGAQLIVTPEGVLEGYVVNEFIGENDPQKKADLASRFNEIAEPNDGPYANRFARLADELNVHLILGMLEADGDRTYNTAVLFGPEGEVVGKYRKTHFHQGYEVNPPGYTAGDTYPVFKVGAVNVGMMICFDRQLPEPARQLALNGADIIACPSYGGYGDWNTRLMQVRAYENQTYVVFCHPEQSLILDRSGELLTEGKRDTFVIHDLDTAALQKTRPSVVHRRPDTYNAQP